MLSSLRCASHLALALASVSTSMAQYVTTNGVQFSLNGSPLSFAGANLWPIAMISEEYVTSSITAVKQKGFPVIRVAAWNEKDPAHGKDPGQIYLQSWANGVPTINEGPTGFGLLDLAVKQAEENDITFIMGLTNNWNDYGGMDTYVANIIPGNVDHTNFYTNRQVIDSFKRYITFVINRYKNSKAIFAWELANEGRCQQPNCQGTQVLTKWADEISQYIKSIDPNHLVTFGGYGFIDEGKGAHNWDFNYDGDAGEDFANLLALKAIDFGTVHHYTDKDTPQDQSYGLQWIKDHNNIAVKANKPLIVEELGVNRDGSGGVQSMSQILASFEKYMSDPAQSAAIAGTLLWSADVDNDVKCPNPADPYAICSSEKYYKPLVTNFMSDMSSKSQPQQGDGTSPPPSSTTPASGSGKLVVPDGSTSRIKRHLLKHIANLRNLD